MIRIPEVSQERLAAFLLEHGAAEEKKECCHISAEDLADLLTNYFIIYSNDPEMWEAP